MGTVFQLWHRCTSQLYINSTILGEGYTTKSIKRHTKAHLTLSLNWSSTGAGPGLLGAVVAVMDVGVRHQIHRGLGVLVHQPRARPPPAHAATADHQMWGWLILFPNWTYSLQLYHWCNMLLCCHLMAGAAGSGWTSTRSEKATLGSRETSGGGVFICRNIIVILHQSAMLVYAQWVVSTLIENLNDECNSRLKQTLNINKYVYLGNNLVDRQPDIWPPNFFMVIHQGPIDMSQNWF